MLSRITSRVPQLFKSQMMFRNYKTTQVLVGHNVGLSNFMSKVYTQASLGVLGTLGTAYVTMPMLVEHPGMALGCGFVGAIAGIIGINRYEPVYHSKTIGTELVKYAEDHPMRKWSFAGLSASMGIMMAPFLDTVTTIDPWILPNSMIVTSLIIGGSAVISKYCGSEIMTWKGPLMLGLTSLIGLQLVSLGSLALLGPNPFASMMLGNVSIYGGIALFTGFSVYDSYMARVMYEKGTPDHMRCSVEIYLDFINLLIDIMRLMAKKD